MRKRGIAILIAALIASSVIVTGTYAWFSLVQRVTNEFSFEPCDVRLIKLDRDTGQRLQGAVFDLKDSGGNIVRANQVTDGNGEILIYNIDLSKQYYFEETIAPHGYDIETPQKKTVFTPDGQDITVYNKRKPSSLTITKIIDSKDIEGSEYDVSDEDKEFPFAFTVSIGDDKSKSYSYVISNAYGTINDYSYNYAAPFPVRTVNVTGTGTIKSGEKIYLRHGEIAEFYEIAALTTYSVIEDNYFIIEYDPDFNPAAHDYGCSNDQTDGHSEHFATAKGWAGYGHNTTGSVPEDGSIVSYENKFVPDGYEVTISSLVVVDRIIAHQDDIDHKKSFEVTIVIGDNPDQQYYYEVVHIEDSVPHIDGYDHEYEYYHRNDPTPQYHIGKGDDVEWNGSPSAPAALTARAARFGLPVSLAALNPPLHYPHDSERWERKDNTYQPLSTSQGNTITVDLHHSSAIIVYGIPVGTQYSAEQVDYRYIDGYMIDSTYKTVGTILPDLEVLPDDDDNTDDPHLQRVRADIYNYFVLPVMRTYDVQKNWIHDGPYGTNPESERPTSTVVHVVDQNSQITYDSRELAAIGSWADSMTVPKYDDAGKLIDYTLAEDLPPDYMVTGLDETDDSFTLTNTYAPGRVKPSVQKTVIGNPPSDAEFTFEIRPDSVNPGAPMPSSSFVTIQGAGVAFFDDIQFTSAGAFVYRIAERHGTAAGYTYDESEYIMTVVVEESSGDFHVTSCTYTKDGASTAAPLLFVNEYNEDTLGSLTVHKAIAGVGSDPQKEFRFTVNIGGDKQVIYLRGGDSRIFTDIPVGTEYSVTEDVYEDYTTEKTGDIGFITKDGSIASFVNKNDTPKEKSTLTVTKTVNDGKDSTERFSFTVTLDRYTYHITLADGEKYVFTDIPVDTPYSVREEPREGYIISSEGTDGTIAGDGNKASFINTAGEAEGVGSLTITKEVAGRFVDETKKFRFSITIGKTAYELFLKHGQSYTFTDIPAGTDYSVIEDDYSSQDYKTSGKGATGTVTADGVTAAFVNAYTSDVPPKPDDDAVQISGVKTWTHGANKEIPQSITVYVMNGNSIVAQKTVTADDNWSYAFNLPKFDADGNEIEYTINEEAVRNYKKAIKGYDLENTYSPASGPQTGDDSVIWIWFVVIFIGIVGLRIAVFWKRKGK